MHIYHMRVCVCVCVKKNIYIHIYRQETLSYLRLYRKN